MKVRPYDTVLYHNMVIFECQSTLHESLFNPHYRIALTAHLDERSILRISKQRQNLLIASDTDLVEPLVGTVESQSALLGTVIAFLSVLDIMLGGIIHTATSDYKHRYRHNLPPSSKRRQLSYRP